MLPGLGSIKIGVAGAGAKSTGRRLVSAASSGLGVLRGYASLVRGKTSKGGETNNILMCEKTGKTELSTMEG